MSIKSVYRKFLNRIASVCGVSFAKQMDSLLRFHRILHLKHPRSLADKLCWIELHDTSIKRSICSDKYAVRDYVKEHGLSEILVPLCQPVCRKVTDISFESLPDQFVMKATHGSAMNFICSDKKQADKESLMRAAEKWLREDFSRACLEPHYLKIPHGLIFEQYLADPDEIIDYKFHCFYGKPDFILACGSRRSGVQKALYTPDWVPIDAMCGREKSTSDFKKPADLSRMLEISRILSSEFDFVRVDLYDINGNVYFGELTFSPASGILPNFSTRFLREKGALLTVALNND